MRDAARGGRTLELMSSPFGSFRDGADPPDWDGSPTSSPPLPASSAVPGSIPPPPLPLTALHRVEPGEVFSRAAPPTPGGSPLPGRIALGLALVLNLAPAVSLIVLLVRARRAPAAGSSSALDALAGSWAQVGVLMLVLALSSLLLSALHARSRTEPGARAARLARYLVLLAPAAIPLSLLAVGLAAFSLTCDVSSSRPC